MFSYSVRYRHSLVRWRARPNAWSNVCCPQFPCPRIFASLTSGVFPSGAGSLLKYKAAPCSKVRTGLELMLCHSPVLSKMARDPQSKAVRSSSVLSLSRSIASYFTFVRTYTFRYLKSLSFLSRPSHFFWWRRTSSASKSVDPKTAALSLSDRIPRDAWDSHMHIVDPKTYPLSRDAQYEPDTYTLQDARGFETSVGLANMVLVQPSIYGHDNNCMLDAMKLLGPAHCRGVVVFDPLVTSPSTLREWHELGVRGVRVNLQSVGKCLEAAELESVLTQYADVVRPLGWVVQVYVPMHMIPMLEEIVPRLGVRLCIDHIGHPALPTTQKHQDNLDPYTIPGFKSLIQLLKGGQTFVKLSAPYRIGETKDGFVNLAPVVHEILAVAGKSKVVFATDWPHTRFEGLDIRPWMGTVLEWCGNDHALIERLFRGNAEDLWGVQRKTALQS